MANRVFICGIFVLWIGSMSWLVAKKLAPSLHNGEPPVISGFDLGEPVAWRVRWSGEPAGVAVSVRRPGVSGTTQLHNRIVVADVPLLELAPSWMRSIVGDIGKLTLDAQTLLEFDSLDNFTEIRCSIGVNDVPAVLTVRGRLEDSQLRLTVRSGQLLYERSPQLRPSERAALSEALFPNSKLPYLYVGRTWTEEVFNPLLSPNSPVELIEAEVVADERLYVDDAAHRVMRVEYRSPPAPGIPEEARLQAIAWVSPADGVVLRQELHIGPARLRFDRMSPEESRRETRRLLGPLDDEMPEGSSIETSALCAPSARWLAA